MKQNAGFSVLTLVYVYCSWSHFCFLQHSTDTDIIRHQRLWSYDLMALYKSIIIIIII